MVPTTRAPTATGFGGLGLADLLIRPSPLSDTKSPRPSSARRFRCFSRAVICWRRRPPVRARPPPSRCLLIQRLMESRPTSCGREERRLGHPHAGARPRADARARHAGGRGDAQVRPRHRHLRGAGLRRRADVAADPRARARRRHRRRDARAARSITSAAARSNLARSASRAGRSRRDARHGIRGGHRRDPRRPRRRRGRRRCFPRPCRRGIASIAERHLRDPARDARSRERRPLPASCRACARWRTSCRARNKPRRCSACWTWRAPPPRIVFCRTRLEVDALVETLNVARLSRGSAARRHGAAAARSR